VFLLACVTLVPLAALFLDPPFGYCESCALGVSLPTTIGGLLSAIGIAGWIVFIRKERHRHEWAALSEAAGDVDTCWAR